MLPDYGALGFGQLFDTPLQEHLCLPPGKRIKSVVRLACEAIRGRSLLGIDEVWYRFGGRELGYVGNNGTSRLSAEASIMDRRMYQGSGAFRTGATVPIGYADFAQSSTPLNSYGQGSAAGGYVVQRTGETLGSIASQMWGDASLWYQLAEANGLQADAALVAGQRLTVPAGVVKSHHNAATFRPYDANDALGNVSPTTPKPPKKNKCGVFGQILLAVVAIAVTVIALPAGPASFGQGVLAGLAGSSASQAVGLATGIQSKFDFKGLALSALSGGVTAGLGSVIKGGSFAANVARGALGSAVTQGVGVATGLQSRFSWASVAAGGIGAGVGAGLESALKLSPLAGAGLSAGNLAGHALAGTAGALAAAATRSAIEGTSFGDNILRELPGAIGNTVGRAVSGAMARTPRLPYADVGSDDRVSSGDAVTEPALSEPAPNAGGSSQRRGGGSISLSGLDYSEAGAGAPSITYLDADQSIVVQSMARPTPKSDYWRARIDWGRDSSISGGVVDPYEQWRTFGLVWTGNPSLNGSLNSGVYRNGFLRTEQYRVPSNIYDPPLGDGGLLLNLALDAVVTAGFGSGIRLAGRLPGIFAGKELAVESAGARGLGASPYARNGDLVRSIATRADNWGIRNGLGNGPVAGTLKHGYAEEVLNRYQLMFGSRGLTPEARYVAGRPWRSGMTTTGSIRLDVVEGSLANPTHVWDYKFGQATLSSSRITQIQNGIPNGANVPILMVKP